MIRASRAGEVGALVAALADERERGAAIARLRVIGARAVDRLSTLATDPAAAPAARAAAFKVLDGSDDPRTFELALGGAADAEPEVAANAIAVLRGWLTRERGTRALDVLTTVALDASRDSRVRLAALDALSQMPRELVGPVLQQAPPIERGIELDDPLAAREWLAAHQDAPLSELHALVVSAREREQAEASARRRYDWLVTRGAAHAVLARRGSRVALYDLREAFDAATTPLPLDFLTAVMAIGDASCLEPMARAWSTAPAGETWWRERLSGAAEAIVDRTRLSGRSRIMQRLRRDASGFI